MTTVHSLLFALIRTENFVGTLYRNLDEEAFKLFIEETPSVDDFDMDSWLMEGRW